MSPDEVEGLLWAMAPQFGGDPVAIDATRVLRVPGFPRKKYENDFYIDARKESTEAYPVRDFKLHIGPRTRHVRISTSARREKPRHARF
jgi:hypothetical protein